jgi:hypothetical protein
LRKDQRDFPSAIDDGFGSSPATGDDAAESAFIDAIKDRNEVIRGLEEQLRKRLWFLRSLEPGRQTLTGKWQNATDELSLTRKQTAFAVTFSTTAYGWARYGCDFKARFVIDRGGLRAGAARHEQTEEEVHNEMTLQRLGVALELRETQEEPLVRWVCPRSARLRPVLFPVGAAE